MTPYAVPRLTRAEVESLRRLRSVFLEEPITGSADYWSSDTTLRLYDATFGRRIAWKWEAVCGELLRRDWSLPTNATAIVDWGCGSGVASEIFLKYERLGARRISLLQPSDRSSLAVQYASRKLRQLHPGLDIGAAPALANTFFLVSHILTELPPPTLEALLDQIAESAGVLWVEPGSHLCSHRLAEIRERLTAKLRVVAPCTHQASCPLRRPENQRHWCHTFAHPPREIFHDGDWSHFASEFGIDLRSLPVSFLCMDRNQASTGDALRLMGRSRHFKGRARILVCGATGLTERDLPFKTHEALIEKLDDAEFEALITDGLP